MCLYSKSTYGQSRKIKPGTSADTNNALRPVWLHFGARLTNTPAAIKHACGCMRRWSGCSGRRCGWSRSCGRRRRRSLCLTIPFLGLPAFYYYFVQFCFCHTEGPEQRSLCIVSLLTVWLCPSVFCTAHLMFLKDGHAGVGTVAAAGPAARPLGTVVAGQPAAAERGVQPALHARGMRLGPIPAFLFPRISCSSHHMDLFACICAV